MSETIDFGSGFFAGDATDVIQSNNGLFATIVQEAVGTFLITMGANTPLQISDYVRFQRDLVGATSPLSWLGVVERVSSTQFRVRQFTKAGLTDGVFGINISRIFIG